MTKTRKTFVPLVMLVALFLVADSLAQDPNPQEAGSLDLLDRGSGDALVTKGPVTMNTLQVGAAGPGVMTVGVLNVTVAMAPAYQGNFYVAPADFPTSWYPFDVTGAFAFGGMLPAAPATVMVAAGVEPGPFTGGGMWDAFGTAMFAAPVGMTPMVFGGPGLFMPGALPVMAPQGVACGLFADPVIGPFLGGLTLAAPTRLVHTFNGPPAGDFLVVGPPALIHYVAGCFVSGATVPVELQSFHID